MFGGECLTTIDTKGRTSIPVRFREVLSQGFGDERFVITKASPVDFGDGSYGRGLSVYPLSEWQELEKKIQANEGGLALAQLNSLKRLVLGPAQECSVDKLGRVLIPPALRLHAALERDLYFVGMGKRFDVWGKETYSRVNAQDERNFPQDSAALAELGI
ncbi:MAG: division/cell wall cluster transcriptional repressor MraZ [Geobacter sp.]|jgi:MraZ protein|uniref:division/cell wall cluster transcriptional repressor MraZ n=1 Tax=Trichlorobacter sp. TaxID=2911007 RepID=UPI002A35B3AB|nr:division/cell wall cluster transcriptional repressor MraZ [Trichlorobacter sp.]MDY0384582.1 division/cell wall cluster transcriptional repressor MraZ [Trichlorobacter sp.]